MYSVGCTPARCTGGYPQDARNPAPGAPPGHSAGLGSSLEVSLVPKLWKAVCIGPSLRRECLRRARHVTKIVFTKLDNRLRSIQAYLYPVSSKLVTDNWYSHQVLCHTAPKVDEPLQAYRSSTKS